MCPTCMCPTAQEDHDVQDTAVQATSHLKMALTKEREIRTQMAEERDHFKVGSSLYSVLPLVCGTMLTRELLVSSQTHI